MHLGTGPGPGLQSEAKVHGACQSGAHGDQAGFQHDGNFSVSFRALRVLDAVGTGCASRTMCWEPPPPRPCGILFLVIFLPLFCNNNNNKSGMTCNQPLPMWPTFQGCGFRGGSWVVGDLGPALSWWEHCVLDWELPINPWEPWARGGGVERERPA